MHNHILGDAGTLIEKNNTHCCNTAQMIDTTMATVQVARPHKISYG